MASGKDEIIKRFSLEPLPGEGGYYKETYRSGKDIIIRGKRRPLCTSILFLISEGSFSRLHRLPFDEIYHFYMGDSVKMLLLFPDGNGKRIILGGGTRQGELPQFTVPAGVWQGTRMKKGGKWALLGTTMSPGFSFNDLILGEKAFLGKKYPSFRNDISKLTP